jgi:hypothetical protein
MAIALLAFGGFLVLDRAYPWAALFIILGLLEFFNLLPAAALRAFIEWRTNPKFKEEYQLTITPEHLHFKTATIDSTLKWTHYSNYIETSKAFILIYGQRMYSVIPKRALTGSEQPEQLRALLNNAIQRT